MMLGLRETFTYLECEACGSLQLIDPPASMSDYYPKDYYSLRSRPAGRKLRALLQRELLRRSFAATDSLTSSIVRFASPVWARDLDHRLLALIELKRRWPKLSVATRLLDVGSGAGYRFLAELAQIGFTNLAGVDPNLPADFQGPGYRVYKRELGSLRPPPRYDVITLHHSLEHIVDQEGSLRSLARLLESQGVIVIRIPIKSDYLWSRYGTDWVELDAPRHVVIHTPRSLSNVAERAGLQIFDSYHDSTAFQFVGSELYKRDIALQDPHADAKHPVSDAERESYQRLSERLNREGRGGRAVFFLRHAR